jgi:hypothetical protein
VLLVVQGEFPDERFLSFQRGKVFRVLLDGGKQQAIVRNDGSFAIYDVRVHVIFLSKFGWQCTHSCAQATARMRAPTYTSTRDFTSLRLHQHPYHSDPQLPSNAKGT